MPSSIKERFRLKHAYLIMAHSNQAQLQRLLEAIDHPRNDIYIHLDKRFVDVRMDGLRSTCKHSAVNVMSIFKSEWGSFDIVRAELALLNAATSLSTYGYYHLLSGQDLPLKCQEHIHSFFDSSGKEFVHFCKPSEWSETVRSRLAVRRFPRYAGKNTLFRNLEWLFTALRLRLGLNQLDSHVHYGFGAQWFSITDNLARELVNHIDWIERHFSRGICTDELFVQSFILSFGHKENLAISIGDGAYEACARYVDWSGGGSHPKILTASDCASLLESKFAFARKFDYDYNPALTDAIVELVKYDKDGA